MRRSINAQRFMAGTKARGYQYILGVQDRVANAQGPSITSMHEMGTLSVPYVRALPYGFVSQDSVEVRTTHEPGFATRPAADAVA